MSPTRVPSSFRDPSGFLFEHEGVLYRQVNPGFRDDYQRMLASGFWDAALGEGLVVPHEELPRASWPPVAEGEPCAVLRPQRIPFVSYPYEWSFSQLRDAALLTLRLQRLALEHDLWLKDASAYNVQFLEGRPVLIDTLSFEAYPEGSPWVAYHQFCRHFLAPLALMAQVHPELGRLARLYIDGVPLELAAAALPWRSRLRPSLLAHLHAHARAVTRHRDARSAARARRVRIGRRALEGLVASLEAAVRRLSWRPVGTLWADYAREHGYSEAGVEHKQRAVVRFLERSRPRSVWDLGANTGRFSRLASERGIPTVAFDADPGAVERAYLDGRARRDAHLLPLVMDLTNPSANLGWDGEERLSLRARGPADLLLALALVHHLAIGNNLPLERIAGGLAGLGRDLVVEFVPKGDPQAQRLLAVRKDVFPDYTREGFERAFGARFELRERVPVPDCERVLYHFAAR